MKNLQPIKIFFYFLLLVSSFVYAQPPINQPNDISACDSDGDGSEIFDLTINNSLMLGSLNSTSYNITFHQTDEDAVNDLNPIFQPIVYQVSGLGNGVYVRVEEIVNPSNFVTTFFFTNVFSIPTAAVFGDVSICSNDSLGFMIIGSPDSYVNYTINGQSAMVQLSTNGDAFVEYSFTTNSVALCLQEIHFDTTYSCSFPLTECVTTTINPIPVFDIQDVTICNGETTILDTGLSASEYSFVWFYNGVLLNETSSSITVNQQGQCHVFATNIATNCYSEDFAYATVITLPDFVQPSALVKFEEPLDGISNFDLTDNNLVILGGWNPDDYVFSYHFSFLDAQSNINAISNFQNYTNTSNSQAIYVRIQENINGCFSVMNFNLEVYQTPNATITPFSASCPGSTSATITGTPNTTVIYSINNGSNQTVNIDSIGITTISLGNLTSNVSVCLSQIYYNSLPSNTFALTNCQTTNINPLPSISQPQDLTVEESNFDGFAIFDLTTNNATILNGLNPDNYTITYYTSLNDAQNALNLVSSPTNYTNTQNPQTIYVRLTNNLTGCFAITNLNLIVTLLDEIINIPDAIFKFKLLNTQCVDTNNDNVGDSDVDINNDGEIQKSESLAVTYLNVSNPWFSSSSIKISDLTGIEFFTNLTSLRIDSNLLQSLNLFGLTNLFSLDCSNNSLQSVNLNGLTNLYRLNCRSNLLESININGLTNLYILDCSNNLLQSLEVSALTNLINLNCNSNQLTTLNISDLTNLNYIDCTSNQLTSIDLSTLINLGILACGQNNLTVLDCTSNINLIGLFFTGNTLLTTVLIKNGSDESLEVDQGSWQENWIFENCPSIQYVCADEFQWQSIQQYVGPNVEINTYCSFTPGGNYNTISGNIKLDANNNGCDTNDLSQANIRVNINDGTNTGSSFTNSIGNYKFYTQAGSFDLTPEIENPSFFNFTPATATIPFANNNNNTATQDFCIAANGVHPDLEVVLAPIAPARPGFDATYQLVYKNKGNQTLSGSVNLVFDDAKTDFVSANPAVDNLAVNSLTWNYINLLPFESRSIDVVLNVNSPLETPAVNIGDVLNFTANINPISGDELPDDNTFTLAQTVVGSFDPNDITCLEGNNVAPSEIGEYLHYVINFENTGNYPAENVVVKTIVDTEKFDINSLQLLNTSNPVDARITGNVVEFIFENIQLGGPGGHGHILLKIKSKNTLVAGDAVAKNANIYFDYNAPVDTNLATTVFQSLSNTVFEKDDSINVSPNPTSGIVNISSNFNIKKLELYDVQGRVLETHIGETKTIDISEKANGIYFLKITTEKGSKVEKVIKE